MEGTGRPDGTAAAARTWSADSARTPTTRDVPDPEHAGEADHVHGRASMTTTSTASTASTVPRREERAGPVAGRGGATRVGGLTAAPLVAARAARMSGPSAWRRRRRPW